MKNSAIISPGEGYSLVLPTRQAPDVTSQLYKLRDSKSIENLIVHTPEFSTYDKDEGSPKLRLSMTSKVPGKEIPTAEQNADLIQKLQSGQIRHMIFVCSTSGPHTAQHAISLGHLMRFYKRMASNKPVISVVFPKGYSMREEVDHRIHPKTGELEYLPNVCRDFAEDLKNWGADRICMVEPHSYKGMGIYQSVFGTENCLFFTYAREYARTVFKDERLRDKFGPQFEAGKVHFLAPDGGEKQLYPAADDYIYQASVIRAVIAERELLELCGKPVPPYENMIANIPLIGKNRSDEKTITSNGVIRGGEQIVDSLISLIDDETATVGTLLGATEACRLQGAAGVVAGVAHANPTSLLNSPHKNSLDAALHKTWQDKPLIDIFYASSSVSRTTKRMPQLLNNGARDRFQTVGIGELIAKIIEDECALVSGQEPKNHLPILDVPAKAITQMRFVHPT